MKTILIIAKRELNSFFDSLIAYILIAVFLGLTGLFTWFFLSDVFGTNQASIKPFFAIAYWTLFFFIPALTMRMLAEEKKTGTIELLLTKAVTNWQVILGKFLGCLMLVFIAIVCSLPYYLTVTWLGPVDHGAVWIGYLGILLLSSTYISIGLFASSLTSDQIIALLLALLIGGFFIIFGFLSWYVPAPASNILHYLSMSTHYEPMTRGVVDTKDILYFMSITAFCLFSAESILSQRNAVDAT